VILDDPKGAVPSYDAILLTSPARANDPRFLQALQPLINRIDVETMREANYQVDREDDKKTPREAARWLNQQIDKGRP
jgi:osmoprotectant transport system permease protein